MITTSRLSEPKMPRQASMVKLSSGMSRVKKPAVLQAMAEMVTNSRPSW